MNTLATVAPLLLEAFSWVLMGTRSRDIMGRTDIPGILTIVMGESDFERLTQAGSLSEGMSLEKKCVAVLKPNTIVTILTVAFGDTVKCSWNRNATGLKNGESQAAPGFPHAGPSRAIHLQLSGLLEV